MRGRVLPTPPPFGGVAGRYVGAAAFGGFEPGEAGFDVDQGPR